jgi:hypothetical protein
MQQHFMLATLGVVSGGAAAQEGALHLRKIFVIIRLYCFLEQRRTAVRLYNRAIGKVC